MGSSCFQHSPFCHSRCTPYSWQCCFQPPLSFSPLRNAPNRRAIVSCSHQENPKDCNSCARRAAVFAGFALLPLLNSRVDAIKGFAAENDEPGAEDQKQKTKGSLGKEVDPVLELLARPIIEEMADILSLHEKFEMELLNEKDVPNKALAEANLERQSLAEEVRLATEHLSESNEKLKITSQELAAAVQKCDSLEKELFDAHEKAESAALALKQEKLIISSLIKDLLALETQISKDKESRKSLEADVEEATKSLDEMNKHALVISEELELANNQILSLEDGKAELYRSLIQQKRAHQVVLENLEDAHNLIVRLGNKRESLQKRGEKLEEVLASAKGEILRLRSQINDENQKPVDVGDKADHPTRKVTRRRKANRQQKDP
ncbi:MAR-binding filament-like protein 1-1 [Sesamum indicum]|uniref:MAR-binding filament-like protein 1-1 n=1 Tax=Sesamum indicum TaxID=4182 RepID=A0A6I9SX77_SESIN|nr:MAR-binding filament-like protein 1-1 [Sesamum indicum]